jgi:hypothetical protein
MSERKTLTQIIDHHVGFMLTDHGPYWWVETDRGQLEADLRAWALSLVRAERERCAKIADAHYDACYGTKLAPVIAQAIRALKDEEID